MPFELGLFLGAKWLGQGKQRQKKCVILDVERYRYRNFLSDIAGQDIRGHNNDVKTLIRIVRNWLRSSTSGVHIPGGDVICRHYEMFRADLPLICKRLHLDKNDLTYVEYCDLIREWLSMLPPA